MTNQLSGIPANQLIRLRGGKRDGDYMQLERPDKYPNSVIVDNVPGALSHQIPSGRDTVYMITNDHDPHGVRIYDERRIDPEIGAYPPAITHSQHKRRDG